MKFGCCCISLPKRNNERVWKKFAARACVYIFLLKITHHVISIWWRNCETKIYMFRCTKDFVIHRFSSMDVKSLLGGVGVGRSNSFCLNKRVIWLFIVDQNLGNIKDASIERLASTAGLSLCLYIYAVMFLYLVHKMMEIIQSVCRFFITLVSLVIL